VPLVRRIPWTRAELRVLDRHLAGLLAGSHASLAEAVRACLSEFTRLRRSPRGSSASPPRTYQTVYTRFWRDLRSSRRGSRDSFWTADEQGVVDRFVRALVRGRYRRAQDAAEACHREFARLRQLHPLVWRARTPRTVGGVFMRVVEGARAAGRDSQRVRWTDAELAVLNRHARALACGRFRDARAAAASCHAEINRLVPRPPRRVRTGVCVRLELATHVLGWHMDDTRWLPGERDLLEKYALVAARGKEVTIRASAQACQAAIARLYQRFRARHPSDRDGYVQRTYKTIHSYIEQRAGELGRKVDARWSAEEDAAMGRYALALLDGQYRDGKAAARACRRELATLRRGWREADPHRYSRTRMRSYCAVRHRIVELAHAHERRWPKTAWNKEELAIMRSWLPWYRRHRGSRGFPAMRVAAEGIQEELESLGSRRSVAACYGMFQQTWSRLNRPA